jgi:U2 small nuclear ribonucleoprotein B''
MGSSEGQSADAAKIKPQPSYPPNATLYLSNIDWSIKKPLLKRSLVALFSRHGKVIEVICLRGDSVGKDKKAKCLRGQAWVIFESLPAATAALEAERGFVFFGRPLMVNYAKEVSDRVSKRDGTYNAKTKERRAKRKLEAGEERVVKSAKVEGGSAAFASAPETKEPGSTQASNEPSTVLLAKNLPSECNDMMLAMLFRQYSGYKKVSMGGGNTAMIEFETDSQATAAHRGLNGFKLSATAKLDLSYLQQ